MNKITTKLCMLLFAVSFTAFAQTRTTMYVSGRDILTACGEKVVMRGVNEMMIWSGTNNITGTVIFPEIAKTGANAVRLAWTTSGSVTQLDQMIANCIANKMIPIPELHDATGSFSRFQQCLDYWKRADVAAVIQKHKKWVIVNIANEVGQGETDAQYEAYYKDGITQLRNAGYDMPLMIDAGGYGNQEKYVVNTGVALMAHDPRKNLIFSVHTYWGGTNQTTRLDALVTAMKTRNLPWVVGEGPQKAATPQSCTVLFPYIYLLDKFQTEGLGWLSWSWGTADNNDCGAPNSVFDMTSDGKFATLNAFGQEICTTAKSSIKNTSIRPASLGGICSPTAITNEENNLSILKVFPNPTEGNLFIEGQIIEKWMLYNVLGYLMLEGNSNKIDIQSLANGVYTLQANGQNIKIVKN